MNRSTETADLPTDAQLLADTAAGNQAAFRVLYDRFERRVFRYVCTFIRQPTLAEEVVIDAMTAVWHGAPKFTGASRASTWIFGIARHKALDALRKNANRSDAVSLDEIDDIEDGRASPSADADRASGAREMQRALAKLSDDHREIVRLAFYEELPYDDIATLLAIPANTVKTRVFYAKQQLKRELTRLGVEVTP
jgi:RNA polymerase sigma-70 factor (ECF subfamily)